LKPFKVIGITPSLNKISFKKIEDACLEGMKCLQVRDKTLEINQVVKISKNIRKEFPNLFLILNGPPLMASDIGFDGVHLPDKKPSQEWLESYKKNKKLFLSTSVHDSESLKRLETLEFNAILISQIKNPISKNTNLKPLGWSGFESIAQKTKVPAYALGGLKMDDLKEAKEHGAKGIAMTGYFFK